MVKRDCKYTREQYIDWSKCKVTPLSLDWSIEKEDMIFSNKTGIHLLNNVITKLYTSEIDIDCDELSTDHEECFLMMIARDGSWQVNTVVKGFAKELGGLASSILVRVTSFLSERVKEICLQLFTG